MRETTGIVAVFALASLAILGTGGVEASDRVNATEPRIVEVAPNPTASDDRGEHAVLWFPAATPLANWSLADGEDVVHLPERTARGRVVVSGDPDAVVTDNTGVVIEGDLALANAGETIRLLDGNETVSRVSYEDAPEGERYARVDSGWTWRRAGATDFAVRSVSNPRVRAFVLPDAANLTVDALGGAQRRVLLAGYTFESARTTQALCTLRDRGVEVRVLLEREPVGGITTRAAERLDALSACGVSLSLLGGEHARYSFHHAKYAVVDDAALVLSENWKPSGVGGQSNRGWGVLIDDPGFASDLARVFRADWSWRDATAWDELADLDTVKPLGPPATGRYPVRFPPRNATPRRVDLLLAPDNAEDAVVDLLESATKSILIEQMAIGSRAQAFVNATLRAARRGVRVRVLLSSADYTWRENRALVAWLNDRADAEGLPLRARLVDPRSRFDRLHVKGVIVDDAVVVGSLNWNAHATQENREAAVVLHGSEVADYYRGVFRADWRGGVWRLPVGALSVVMLGLLAGCLSVRRMQFEPQSARSP